MKVVLDSNVLLAAFGTRGLCESLLEACLAAHDLYTSQAILDELREHLADKFRLSPSRITEIVVFLKAESTLVEPLAVPHGTCRDADDLVVLGTALAAGAHCIVTGDKDLLTLGQHRGIAILSPRALYDRLR